MTPIMFVDYQPEMFYDLGATSPEAKCEFQLPEDVELESFLMNMEGGLNPKHWLFGSDIETLPKSAVAKHHYQHMSQFMHTWALDRNDNEFVDVMELCGGTARVSHLLIRRWHRKPYNVGKNFDAIVGYDLLDATQQACYWQYLKRTQPLVIIISTPCTGLMGWKHLNAIRAPETHAR